MAKTVASGIVSDEAKAVIDPLISGLKSQVCYLKSYLHQHATATVEKSLRIDEQLVEIQKDLERISAYIKVH